jgi:glycosyltransferase involved in cell wall biosynthesis
MPKLLIATTVPVTLRAFLLPYAEHFRALGWRVDAMANGVTAFSDCVHGFDRVYDVNWSRNPLHPSHFLSVPKRIREVVSGEDYDLVHAHTPVASFVTRYALRNLRRVGKPRVLYTAHGFHFHQGGSWLKNTLFRTLERRAGAWTDYLVVINRDDEKAARDLKLVPPERLRYMPGIGVDTRLYAPENVSTADVEAVRNELGLTPRQPLLLMIAEFNRGKRHRDALHALAALGRPDVVLACAGTGPLEAETKTLADDLGIAKQLRFLGYRRDVPALIRASRAVLLPSEREGLPRSLMESLSLEVPCLGTEIRGITDLLSEGVGLLAPVGDAAALAQHMAWVLDHPVEARAMGVAGRKRMAAVYDIQHLLQLHEDLYHEALAGAARTQLAGA